MRAESDRVRRTGGALVILALIALGVVAIWLSAQNERSEAARRDLRAADLAATRLNGAFQQALGAMRGVDVMAVDGIVEPGEFAVFAEDVVGGGTYSALAFALVVDGAERELFETTTGLELRDTDGQGGFVPAESRPLSLVVVEVYPVNETTRPVLGFDLASDPTRLAAARKADRTGEPVISNVITVVTGAYPGVAAFHAVRSPAGETIGFVTSGLGIEGLLERSGIDVTSFDRFALLMDGVLLVGSDPVGESSSFEIAGHEFEIVARSQAGVDRLAPFLIGAGTVVLAVSATIANLRDRRQRALLDLAAEQQRQLIVELQRNLLPAPLTIEGLDPAVAYRPAMSVVGLGGDFYDVVQSCSGRIYLTIGDVTGHGSEAVATMAELKAVMHHLLETDAPLLSVCDEADRLLARRRTFATAQLVEIDRAANAMHLVNAGHLPPVVRRVDGSTEVLSGGLRPLLGLQPAASEASSVATFTFEAGDLLLLYTDGLVECRDETIDESMQILRDEIGALEAPDAVTFLDELIRRTEQVARPDRIDDDMAALAVMVTS